MIDLDSVLFVEYGDGSATPLALIEVARDVGQATKSAAVVGGLARAAGLPAYTALYTLAGHANPGDGNWSDIDHFRVRRVWPRPERGWRRLSPSDWAEALWRIRSWQLRRYEGVKAANDDRFHAD